MSGSKKIKKINAFLLSIYLIGSVIAIILLVLFINNRGIDLKRLIGNFLYFAVKDENKITGKKDNSGKNTANINLYPHDPTTDEIINGTSYGKLIYNLAGPTFDVNFTGAKLTPNRSYTLIYFPEKADNSWPRQGIICLGSGTSDDKGDLSINNTSRPGSLPKPDDLNAQRNGAQIILVDSNDVRCQENWDVSGSWEISYDNNSNNEVHSAYFIQKISDISGSGGYPVDSPFTKSWRVSIGTIYGNRVDLDLVLTPESTCLLQMEGTVGEDGTISGLWADDCSPILTKTWKSLKGKAGYKPVEMFNNNKAHYLYAISLINYQETL